MAIALLADQDHGSLTPATARLVGALAPLGMPLDLIVAGEHVAALAKSGAKLAGIRRVLTADHPAYRNQGAESLAALLQSLAPGYTHIVASATATGRDTLPRLAALLDVMPVTDVIAIHDPARFDRPIYAGNAIETVAVPSGKILLTLRPSAFPPAPESGQAPIEPLEIDPVEGMAEFLVAHRSRSDTPDLSTARIVVSGGVALGSAYNFEMIGRLAEVLGAAVGATRAAVDAGYAPNDWQVGQTGKTVAPDLYIAIGISGALQHLAGIGGAKKIVAINSDPEAPLMKLADIALVGDLFEIVPQLIAALDARRPSA